MFIYLYDSRTLQSQAGKGVAAVLADAAFTYLKQTQQKAFVSCEYLRKSYLPKHPELDSVILREPPK
jgi:predicted GNAT family acetyltransferase